MSKGAVLWAVVLRLLVGALAWWALSEGRAAYAAYGLVAVPLGVAASFLAFPPGRRAGVDEDGPAGRRGGSAARAGVRAVGTVRLIGYYLVRMTVGGVDVARRVLRTPVDVDPVVLTVPVRLPAGTARDIALAMMNVMPGSLVQEQHEASVELHVLSADMDAATEWERLEARMARAAGIDLA